MNPLSIVAAIVVIVFVSPGAQNSGQPIPCAALNWSPLQSSDPAYADALDLSRALADRGFVVQCVAPSVMVSFFEGQVGAAIYKTSQGEIDALFLRKGQDFEGLQIIERQEGGRYLYSFAGRPKPRTDLIDAARRVYFIKNLNRLLVADDEALVARLRSTLIG